VSGHFNAEKLSCRLCCKAGKIIKSIEELPSPQPLLPLEPKCKPPLKKPKPEPTMALHLPPGPTATAHGRPRRPKPECKTKPCRPRTEPKPEPKPKPKSELCKILPYPFPYPYPPPVPKPKLEPCASLLGAEAKTTLPIAARTGILGSQRQRPTCRQPTTESS
jgi:hypothetical protein